MSETPAIIKDAEPTPKSFTSILFQDLTLSLRDDTYKILARQVANGITWPQLIELALLNRASWLSAPAPLPPTTMPSKKLTLTLTEEEHEAVSKLLKSGAYESVNALFIAALDLMQFDTQVQSGSISQKIPRRN